MGVFKFYKWAKSKYAHITSAPDEPLPPVDNLYLDMNGIIHQCCHKDGVAIGPFNVQILGIFRYLDRLICEVVKPTKLLFIGVDGCAPRAKLNQQRSRRYLATMNSNNKSNKSNKDKFDICSITPGTEFMWKVSRHIKWFIRHRIKHSLDWQKLTIIYSGVEVPGEGEHKIMSYIREMRSLPLFDRNLSHCIYGADSDIIMLSLCTHEEKFIILRESFNPILHKKGKKMGLTFEPQFEYVRINLLRDYIYNDIVHDGKLPDYSVIPAVECESVHDKERIIDDFVFITFFVGNDFLPHALSIVDHAIELILQSYKDHFIHPRASEYLITRGKLDLGRMEVLLQALRPEESKILTGKYAHLQQQFYLDNNQQQDLNKIIQNEVIHSQKTINETHIVYKTILFFDDTMLQNAKFINGHYDGAAVYKLPGVAITQHTPVVSKNIYNEIIYNKHRAYIGADGSSNGEVLQVMKRQYYLDLFQIDIATPSGKEALRKVTESYISGLSWCLGYYFSGCPSWTYYYPYYYAPLLSDLHDLATHSGITFDLGAPLHPFQQLAICLSTHSSYLLPSCYVNVMDNPQSPVYAFYPREITSDMIDMSHGYGTVHLPFIETSALLAAESMYCDEGKYTEEEKGRNTLEQPRIFRYSGSNHDTIPSCNRELNLIDIVDCLSDEFIFAESTECPIFESKLLEGTVPSSFYPSLDEFLKQKL